MQKNIENYDILFDNIFTENSSMNAFTLAEVLITLGIIGVVAAMVMPTLMNNVQDKVLETQSKKAKNIVANGYKLMMAKSSVMDVANIPFLSECYDERCMSNEHKTAFNIIDDSAGNLKASSMPDEYAISGQTNKSPFKWEDVFYMFAANDGMIYGVVPSDDRLSFDVITDVNGIKNPNIAKKDLHKFRFSGSGTLYDVSGELEEFNSCSAENPSNCKTYEECASIACSASVFWQWGEDKCILSPSPTLDIPCYH